MLFKIIKQIFKSGRRPLFGTPQSVVTGASLTISEQSDLEEVIEFAASQVTQELPDALHARLVKLSEAFDLHALDTPAPLNVFVFHVTMGESGKLSYRDVTMDVSKFDYRALLGVFKECVLRWHPRAHIYLVTGGNGEFRDLQDACLSVVNLDLASDQPMYERVVTMCAYARSRAFNADTLFLDSDAFINADFSLYLNGDFDIAITTRDIPGLMPVNEGVLVARAGNRARVQAFFDRYLATYERLVQDAKIESYYGDIRKWRGGQLALNAVTRDAAPYSFYRQLDLHGVHLRVLPCDPFNYSFEYGQKVTESDLCRKVIVHLKGGRKTSLDMWSRYLRNLDAKRIGRSIIPNFALWNKEYKELPFSDNKTRTSFVGAISKAAEISQANVPGSNALLADDMFVWFRNVGFLSDPDFIAAMGPLVEDPTLRARIWRVYTLCWAAKSCLPLDGDFIDVGCYDGKTVSVIERYCEFRSQRNKKYWMYDMFENPPVESAKAGHGPGLYDVVRAVFEPLGNFKVIKGSVPDSFAEGLPEHIAFAQIDLNAAEPELACLRQIYDRIVVGGMIVFDDFGFSRYRASRSLEAEYLAEKGHVIWESPTGQGLFIKRQI